MFHIKACPMCVDRRKLSPDDRPYQVTTRLALRPRIHNMTDSAADCPFCDIVKKYPHPYKHRESTDGEEPLAHVVYSTHHVIAFLDRLPLTKCHTLLIPRNHHELISSTPTEIAAEMGRALPVVCHAVVQVSGADAFNVVQNNG